MAPHSGWKFLFVVWLCSSCYAQLNPVELRQVEYHVDNENNNVDNVADESSTENNIPQNIPNENDIEEPFKKASKSPYCLGCVINVPTDQPGVTEMAERAVSAMDQVIAAPTIHATPRVLGVQKQVVNGIQYYIQIEVYLSDCPPSPSVPRSQCNPLPDSLSLICEVIFLDQPWKDPKRQLMGNNCTDANSDNDIENYTPDDLLAVERRSGVGSTYPTFQDNDETQTSTEGIQEATTTEEVQDATTLVTDNILNYEEEDRNGRRVNAGPGIMKPMDRSETNLINELADIAVRTLNELEVGDSHKEVIDILDAKKQIVNGLMYHLVLRVGSKSCSDDTAECQMQGWAFQSICNVKLHRSWAEDTPYKAKVVNSECEEAWEEGRQTRQLSDSWVSQDMYDPEYNDCIKKVLSKTYNIVPQDLVMLSGLMRQEVSPMNTQIMAELKLDSKKWTSPSPSKNTVLVLRPKVLCNHEAEKSSEKVAKDLGGIYDADRDSAELQSAVDFAVDEVNQRSNSMYKMKMANVIEAKQQVVSGVLYHLKLALLPTSCKKGHSPDAECTPLDGAAGQECSIRVWSQPWLKKMSVTGFQCGAPAQSTEENSDNRNEQGDLSRAKRSPQTERPIVFGGVNDADKNDAGVQGASAYAVSELTKREGTNSKLVLLELVDAKQQIVQGTSYHLTLRVSESTCNKNDSAATNCQPLPDGKRELCTLKVWSKPWLKEKSVHDVDCKTERTKRSIGNVAGGLSDADKNSEDVKAAVDFAVKELDKTSNSGYEKKAVEVIEAKKQVVAGVVYHLKIRVANCEKSEPSTCEEADEVCSLKVWSRPWLNATELQDVNCSPVRSRRSLGNVPGGLSDADKNSEDVKAAVDFAVKELDKTSNSGYEKKAVDVIEAKKQVVAGALYHLKIRVANCEKSEPSTCEEDQEVCSLKVWSRPWLNATEISDVSCSPDRSKRSISKIKPDGEVDYEVKQVAAFAVNEIDEKLYSIYKSKLVKIKRVAKRSSVRGSTFDLTLKIGQTDCMKYEKVEAAECPMLPNVEIQLCDVTIHKQSPSNVLTLTKSHCIPVGSKPDGERMTGRIRDADKNSEKVKGAVNFAVKELNKMNNGGYEKRAVEVIEAKRQSVASVLYYLKIRVANCETTPIYESSAAPCERVPFMLDEICSVEVRYKPWEKPPNELIKSKCTPVVSKRSGELSDTNDWSSESSEAPKNSLELSERSKRSLESSEVPNSSDELSKTSKRSFEQPDQLPVSGMTDFTPGLRKDEFRMCTVKVLTRKSYPDFSIRDIDCVPHYMDPTVKDIDKDSPEIKMVVDFAVSELEAMTEGRYTKKAGAVLESRKLVGTNIMYYLKVRVFTCKTDASSRCDRGPYVGREFCELSVMSKPGTTPAMQLVHAKCVPLPSKRFKRSLDSSEPTKKSVELSEPSDESLKPTESPKKSQNSSEVPTNSPELSKTFRRSFKDFIPGRGSDIDVDYNSPEVSKVILFAVGRINDDSRSSQKQKVVKVVEAKKQGFLYRFVLKVGDTTCSKSDWSPNYVCNLLSNVELRTCSVKVLTRRTIDEMSIQEISCVPYRPSHDPKVKPGKPVNVDKNSLDVRKALAFGMNELKAMIRHKKKLVEVLDAKKQIVSGVMYQFKLRIANCKNGDSSTCERIPYKPDEVCSLKVLSRPWTTPAIQVDHVNCVPVSSMGSLIEESEPSKRNETIQTLNEGSETSKRAFQRNTGLIDVDTDSAEVMEAVRHAVIELKAMTGQEKKLVEILKAKKRKVAGIMYHLTMLVANCKDPLLCERIPSRKADEICFVKVLSRPWTAPTLRTEYVKCRPLHSKKLIEESEPSKRLIAESEPSNGLIEESEPSKRLTEESEPSKTLTEESEPSKTLTEESEPSKRLIEESEPSERSFEMGGVTLADTNSTEVRSAVDYAMKELNRVSNFNRRYEKRAVEVIKAEQQDVAGRMYLQIRVAVCWRRYEPSVTCDRVPYENDEICTFQVLSKSWTPQAMQLRNVRCSSVRAKRSIRTGSSKVVEDLQDPYIQDIAEYSRAEIDKLTNSIYTQKINRIVEAKKQVVSGVLVDLKLELVRTGCTKNTQDRSTCEALPNQKSQICEITVWDRPWMKRRKIKNLRCADAQIISSREAHLDAAENLFSNFVQQFNKTYDSEVERQKRFEIFKENLNLIKELQDTEQGTATYGPTMFADLTHDEFKNYYLGLRPDLHHDNSLPFPQAKIPNVQVPKEYDWRDHNAVTPVKNQGMCGSCWAFAVTGNVEGQYAIKYKKLLSFSEQELVDCDKLDDGCQGGLPDSAYRALEQLGGLELEEDYPYDGRGESCSFNRSLTRVRIHGGLNITSNETGMAQWLLQNGPIAIGINANAMQFYMGGVSHPLKFLCSPSSLDHGVLIVGFGEHRTRFRKKLLPYWLIKNSWGKFWGEQGYYRVYRGDGSCGVNMMASSAIIE